MKFCRRGIFVGKDILLVIMIAVVAIVAWLMWILLRPDFVREMRILNMEISRTKGESQAFWKMRRRRLWLSLIPFVKYKK